MIGFCRAVDYSIDLALFSPGWGLGRCLSSAQLFVAVGPAEAAACFRESAGAHRTQEMELRWGLCAASL